MSIGQEFQEAAAAVHNGEQRTVTPRDILWWFGCERRGSTITKHIRAQFRRAKIRTDPDWESTWIDNLVQLRPVEEPAPSVAAQAPAASAPGNGAATATAPASSSESAPDEDARDAVPPAHRVSRLEAASRSPVSVRPSDPLATAITLMMKHEYSQLAIVEHRGKIEGMISWRSIGQRLAQGKTCDTVESCLEPYHEVPETASIFDVIEQLSRHDCVLVRDRQRRIAGIVTASDIAAQFRILSEPFVLLGDIEINVRRLLGARFELADFQAVRDPSDTARQIESVEDLSFGEYVRLLQSDTNWKKLHLNLDRALFCKELDGVREIRNKVMHFDPDPLRDADIAALRSFSRFLEQTVSLVD